MKGRSTRLTYGCCQPPFPFSLYVSSLLSSFPIFYLSSIYLARDDTLACLTEIAALHEKTHSSSSSSSSHQSAALAAAAPAVNGRGGGGAVSVSPEHGAVLYSMFTTVVLWLFTNMPIPGAQAAEKVSYSPISIDLSVCLSVCLSASSLTCTHTHTHTHTHIHTYIQVLIALKERSAAAATANASTAGLLLGPGPAGYLQSGAGQVRAT